MARKPALTKEQRVAIVRQSDKQPEWKQNSREACQGARKSKRPPVPAKPPKQKVVKCPQVEKAMLQWMETQIYKDEAVTVTKVQAKAQELVHQGKVSVDGFVVSDSWVDSFMRHHVLNCLFGLSDAETTDCEENEENVVVINAAVTKRAEGGKAGKTTGVAGW
ncbi:Homeodomain-like [Phytophthora cactorum]|nr:Homeodomain-like [Phytophthora cactorum]